MAIKFYKMLSPQTLVVLGNNSSIQFTTLDHLVGWFSTENGYIQEEFERFKKENKYSITEVKWPEFEEDYVKKKSSARLSQPSREQLSGVRREGTNLVETLGEQAVAKAVGVNREIPGAVMADDMAPGSMTKPMSMATPENGFRPPTGPRNKRRQ